jgi:hypothetical protein
VNACVSCGAIIDGGAVCPACAAPLQRSADLWGRLCFNRSLELIAKGDLGGAEEQLCAACALLPSQVEPRRLLGKLRAQRGAHEDAFVDLSWAKQLAPGDAKTVAALDAVEKALVRKRRLASLAVGAMFLVTAAAVLASRFL